MKALTLYDPWATLVVLGEKQYETRSWSTSYRGPLAIHVSKSFTGEMADLCHTEPFRSVLVELEDWPRLGCIIGTVELERCWRMDKYRGPEFLPEVSEKERAFGDWSYGRWAWPLSSPRLLAAPIPCRGHQGLWTVPLEIEELLAATEVKPHG